nr:DNA-directed RNA polymerase III subunit RPC6-like isoform X2 [Nerophis lumbriciformis]
MSQVQVKQEKNVIDPAEVENRIKALCQQFPQGITDEVIQNDMPHLEAQQRAAALNKLLSVGVLDLLKNSNGLLYRLKDTQTASKMKGSDNQEKLVYQIIEDAANKGIWSRDIRFKSNLPLTEINKILKNLESKKLIKAVKSVAAESARDGERSPMLRRNASFATSHQVWKYICELGISKVDLSMEDIETILDTLVYDGKAEPDVMAAKEGTPGCVDGRLKLYRAVEPVLAPAALVRTPCGLCPVFEDCHEGGEISPSTCVYLDQWLDF